MPLARVVQPDVQTLHRSAAMQSSETHSQMAHRGELRRRRLERVDGSSRQLPPVDFDGTVRLARIDQGPTADGRLHENPPKRRDEATDRDAVG
jgi:hypothetical protein